MSYVPQTPVGRVTPGLRDARVVELIGPDRALNLHFIEALSDAGFAIREVASPSGEADAIVLAHGLGGEPLASHTGAVLALGKMAGRLTKGGGTVILLQNSGGRFQPADNKAWLAGLAGLGRTAQREFPDTVIRTIDIDVYGFGPRSAADRVVEELLTGGAAPCVGLSAQGRCVPAETDVFWRTSPSMPPDRRDTVLVTGGARGVTADCIVELASQTGARFVLLGRSEIMDWPDGLPAETDEKKLRGLLVARARSEGRKVTPADINANAKALLAGAEIRDTLSRIKSAGGEALYIPADVGDPDALRRALAKARKHFGAITGLVHGAGVLADKLISEKTEDQVKRVFTPKILGLQSILSEIDPNTLKHIVFFSSVAARYGNAGQSDYAMANEVLNRLAHSLKTSNPGACVTSIGWGPWDGGMVDDGLRARFAEMGIDLISREAGAQIFAKAVMAGAACPVELVVGSELPHG